MAQSGFRRFPPSSHKIIPGLFHDDPDCLHTSAVADLAKAPAVLHLPNTHGRYLSVTLFDAAGEPFASLGSRSGHAMGGEVLIAGPDWRGEPADAASEVRAPSDQIWAMSRILARSDPDRSVAEALAARQRLMPRGGNIRSPQASPTAPESGLAVLELAPLRQIADTPPHHLVHRLTPLIERAPRRFQEEFGIALRGRLALLASERDSAAEERLTEPMRRGFADGWKDIQAKGQADGARTIADWRPVAEFADESASAAGRAAQVLARLGAPLREDIMGLRCRADEAGRPLNGAEQYRILLLGSALPPSLAGWRLTAHNGPVQPGEVIGDDGRLVLAHEDTLELSVQRESPEGVPPGNWLRTPPGPFELTLRLYFPTDAALSGSWRMARVERLGSRVGRRPGEREPPPPPPSPPPPRGFGPWAEDRRLSV